MRPNSFAGRDRKLIPVLLGLVLFGVFAVAQDIDSGLSPALLSGI